MRAAKVQKATLDPTKISGRCGRLMCCLRYEDQTYEELRKKLPKRNTRVRTETGDAWVIDGQILTQLVLVQYDDAKREAVPMEKILEFDRPKPVTPEGRIMQTPHDRPPPGAMADRRPAPGARNAPPPQRRPQPGAPLADDNACGDPRAMTGPTGGDLNLQDASPLDEIDDLIADAMDQTPPPVPGSPPAPRPPQAQPGFRPNPGAPQNAGPRGPRPPQRPPQAFRPPPPKPQPPKPQIQPPPPPIPEAASPEASAPPMPDAASTPPTPPAPERQEPGNNPS